MRCGRATASATLAPPRLVGFGTDAARGAYWLVKNSWSTKFGNDGLIKVARGVSCASIDCCGNVFTVGDPASYYEHV